MDHLLLSFLSLTDSSPLVSLDLSFDRLLDSTPSDADQALLIDRAHSIGSLLLRAANRSARKRASLHNSIAWALPPDLTIKVFSMLDSQSLCYAAATCWMFNKCAMDPLCYENIYLTTVVPETRQGKESYILTRTCLYPLSGDNGTAGALLWRLHLYNIERMDNTSLCVALAACPSLLDLEIVGLHVELRQTLMSVSSNCHLIERLFFESSKTGRDDSLKSQTCVDVVNNRPNLSSLSLRGFKLHHYKVRILVKGFRKLKYADFSTSYSITGTFLRMRFVPACNQEFGKWWESTRGFNFKGLHASKRGEVEVSRFLTAIIVGDFKFLQYLDISNREGLASEGDWYQRSYNPRSKVIYEGHVPPKFMLAFVCRGNRYSCR
ncbi:splicing factor Prp18 family protein [Hibiscus syriacus]|uniref:Splicing factor Prp18 family protein n=1 Tax=Hibiscus syriacus TaxID=106335 RepID=A0A6A2X197_HIBSY|nr:splicing factor Prp18 family protein [Hibiscus syriacus]